MASCVKIIDTALLNRTKERSGYLYKQGGLKGIKGWRKRWVIFNGKDLRYYDNIKTCISSKIIPVSSMESVDNDAKAGGSKRFKFKLKSKRRVYMFAAETLEDCTLWCQLLMEAILMHHKVKGDSAEVMGGKMHNADKEGFIKFNANRNKYYVAVKKDLLCYYKNKEDFDIASPIHEIPMKLASVKQLVKNKLQLSTDYYHFILSFESTDDLIQWKLTFEDAIAEGLGDDTLDRMKPVNDVEVEIQKMANSSGIDDQDGPVSQSDQSIQLITCVKGLTDMNEVLGKVSELVKHLTQFQEYHLKDGMKLQKTLDNFRTEYSQWRSEIANRMSEDGYASASMKMLKTLHSMDVFKNEDIWNSTYHTYRSFDNFSTVSAVLAKDLADVDAVRLLTRNIGHKPYIDNVMQNKRVYHVILSSLHILFNIAECDVKHVFKESKTSEFLKPFIEFNDERLKVLAMLTLTYIVDEEENTEFIDDTGTIHIIADWLNKALDNPNRVYNRFKTYGLTRGLDRLSANANNTTKIVEENVLPMFLRMLRHDDVLEQSAVARALWTMASERGVRSAIVDNKELMDALQNLKDTAKNENVRNHVFCALWILKEEADSLEHEQGGSTWPSQEYGDGSVSQSDQSIQLITCVKGLTDLNEVLEKVSELVKHLTRFQEYHPKDVKKLQQTLYDYTTEYSQWRVQIAKRMNEEGYASASMKLLKTLHAIGIFSKDDIWYATDSTYCKLTNFSDSSTVLAKTLADAGAVRLLTLNIGHKPYIDNVMQSKRVYAVIESSLCILYNIACKCDVKHFFKESKTSDYLKPFIGFKDEKLKVRAMLLLAYIVGEDQNAEFIDDTGTIHIIADWLKKSLDDPKRSYKALRPLFFTRGLAALAVNDSNKTTIVDENVLPMFLRMLHDGNVLEQSVVARALWTMAFEHGVRSAIVDNKELMKVLQNLKDTATDENLLKHVSGALWILKEETDSSKRPNALTSAKTHVFISYCWSDKATVLKIKDRLKEEGYNVWIDTEQMTDNILDAMAQAVENAAIVLMCMSEAYKQSPNCRTEAQYAYKLGKDFIPLILQRKYRPDGWLGLLLGTKLYIDCSRAPLEEKVQELLKELRGRGQVNEPPPHRQDTVDHAESHNSGSTEGRTTAIPNPVHKVCNMTQEDIALWLSQNRLEHLQTAFAQVDGPLIVQLKKMKKQAADYFYQSLKQEFNMTFLDILMFCNALDRLDS